MTRPSAAWLRNGALLGLPPLAISFGLWGSLPAAYAPEAFGRGIPTWLALAENVARVLVFAVPAALVVDAPSRGARLGWAVYAAGVLLYAASYVVLAAWPGSAYAHSAVGFSAPAWTTAVWFLGIALLCRESWLRRGWRWWFYLPLVAAFLALHVTHTLLVWGRS